MKQFGKLLGISLVVSLAALAFTPALPIYAATDSNSSQSGTKQKVTTKTVTKVESINFKTTKQNDSTLAAGKTKVIKAGKKGSKKVTYKVSYTNGKQTAKKQVSSKTTKQPVTQIVAVGTYIAPAPVAAPTPAPAPDPEPQPEAVAPTPASSGNCDPNYSPCIPYYPGNTLNCPDIGIKVQVIGTDHNRFDADGDGYGCDSY